MAITVSRRMGRKRFYITGDSGEFARGTYDRSKARTFADSRELREWFESLSPAGRWAFFSAGAYRIDWGNRRGLDLDEESAAKLDEANPSLGSGKF